MQHPTNKRNRLAGKRYWLEVLENVVRRQKRLRQPGIEPGAKQWECFILPLNHWRLVIWVCSRWKLSFWRTCLWNDSSSSLSCLIRYLGVRPSWTSPEAQWDMASEHCSIYLNFLFLQLHRVGLRFEACWGRIVQKVREKWAHTNQVEANNAISAINHLVLTILDREVKGETRTEIQS